MDSSHVGKVAKFLHCLTTSSWITCMQTRSILPCKYGLQELYWKLELRIATANNTSVDSKASNVSHWKILNARIPHKWKWLPIERYWMILTILKARMTEQRMRLPQERHQKNLKDIKDTKDLLFCNKVSNTTYNDYSISIYSMFFKINYHEWLIMQ